MRSAHSLICYVLFIYYSGIYDILSPAQRYNEWVRYLDYLTTHTILSPIRHGFAYGFINYKKGALDSQPQLIKFTSF